MFDGSQACTGADISLFFPPRGETAKLAVQRAKMICYRCEFIAPCLRYAMTNPDGEYGVWGHTTAGERKAIRLREQFPSMFRDAA